jgi:hypothetical protein
LGQPHQPIFLIAGMSIPPMEFPSVIISISTNASGDHIPAIEK